MEKRERAFYATRTDTLAHQAFIRPEERTGINDLIEHTFAHHIAVFDSDTLYPPSPNAVGPPTQGEIAARFYREHYLGAELYRDVMLDASSRISIEEFIQEVVFAKADGNRTNLFFLLGEVGTGKTAFVNYLMSRYGADWVRNREIWFLRLDVDLFGDGRLLTVDSLVEGLVKKLRHIFSTRADWLELPKNLEGQLENLGLCAKADPTATQLRLARFIREYAQITRRTLFLMIDNLDYLYHVNDRTMFMRRRTATEQLAIQAVSKIVSAFRHDGDNGSLADMRANVLFSLRPDSYNILRESRILFHPSREYELNKNVYSVGEPKWKRVITQRGDLLEYCIGRLPKQGQRRMQEQIIAPIIEDLEYKEDTTHSLINHLLNITNFGLRDVIEFLAAYSWLSELGPNEEFLGYERLMRSYPVGLLIFILGKRRRFSQEQSRFPNIYVVRDWDSADASADQPESQFRAPHSYWLNRLILHFIDHHRRNGEAVRILDILDAFCDDAYSEELTRRCLGNMAQANITNLIRVHKAGSANEQILDVQGILMTNRAIHCLDHVFDRFFYLQLAVDDHALPIPRCVMSEFVLNEFGDDYGYLCTQPREYGEKADAMIRRKARQVAIFLEVLASSYELERQRYKSCFETLESMEVALPRMPEIRRGFYAELRHLIRNRGTIDVDDLDRQARQIRRDVDEALAKAYQTAGSPK